jgi:hypothetical protein
VSVLVLGGAIAAFTVAASSSSSGDAASTAAAAPTEKIIATASRPRGSGLPPPTRVTLDEAAAVMPFTVLAPEPPPPSRGVWVFRSPDDPRFFPQVTIDYLPEHPGHGIGLIEGAKRGRSPRDGERIVERDGRTVYVLDGLRELRRARVVADGTDVTVSGEDATLDELIDIAASLRPVAP